MKPNILLITLIAFALRVYNLNFQPLWGDEGWSIYFATMPLADMIALTAVDIHPPFYYALLHGWFAITEPGAELARFVSVVVGTLLVPVIYKMGNGLLIQNSAPLNPPKLTPNIKFNEGGLICAIIVAVAPMAVYYSQEVRLYGLVTLLGLGSIFFFIKILGTANLHTQKKAIVGYTITTTLALYTMYYAAFIVIFQALYLLVKRRNLLFKLLFPVGLLYLPWIVYAGGKLINYVTQKTDIEAYTPLTLAQFLSSYLIAFSLGHLSDNLQAYTWTVLFFGVVACGGVYYLWQTKKSKVAVVPFWLMLLYLFIPLLFGWLVNLVNPFTPPYFERTLLVAAPAWWLLIGIGLYWLKQKQVLVFVGAIGLLLSINLGGLFDFHTTPRYTDSDYRLLLKRVAAQATPNDVLLASYQWQLGFYYAYLPQPRPQLYAVPGWGYVWGTNLKTMHNDLASLLKNKIWFPAHQTLGHTWEDKAEQIMAEIGYPTLLKWYNPTTKLSLVASKTKAYPSLNINFGHILNAQINLPNNLSFASGHDIIPIQIIWTKLDDFNTPVADYLITLKLVDNQGEIWAKRDTTPRANQLSFAELLSKKMLLDQHGLLVSAGTPPGEYTLLLSLTDQRSGSRIDVFNENGQAEGKEAILAQVKIEPASITVGVEALPIQVPFKVIFDDNGADKIELVGSSVGQWQVKTGDTLPVNLFWRGIDANLPPLTTFVQLQDEQGQAVALTERPPVYPTTKWAANTLLRDLHPLKIPATLSPGLYKLATGVLLADKTRLSTPDSNQVILGMVHVQGRSHSFEPPTPTYLIDGNFVENNANTAARLIGYDLNPQNITPGEAVNLTLYWQGEAGFERSWAIFAHIIDGEKQLWGQQDQLPVNGEVPTTSWIKDEYIIDSRQIWLNSNAPDGTYVIEVGLYDPRTFERVPLKKGGDVVVLENPLVVGN